MAIQVHCTTKYEVRNFIAKLKQEYKRNVSIQINVLTSKIWPIWILVVFMGHFSSKFPINGL